MPSRLRFKDFRRVIKGETGYSSTSAKYVSTSTGEIISGRQFTQGAKGGVRYETLVKASPAKTIKMIGPKLPPKAKIIGKPVFDILAYLPGFKKVRVNKSTKYVSPEGIAVSPAGAKKVIAGANITEVAAKSMGGKQIYGPWQRIWKPTIKQFEFTSLSALLTFIATGMRADNHYSVVALGEGKGSVGTSGGDSSGNISWRRKTFPSPPYSWKSLGRYDTSVKYPANQLSIRDNATFTPGTIVVYTITVD